MLNHLSVQTLYGAQSVGQFKNEKCVFLPVLEQQTLARSIEITNSLLQMSQFMLKTISQGSHCIFSPDRLMCCLAQRRGKTA